MKTTTALSVVFCLLIAGCGTTEHLERISGAVPSASELSGRWSLIEDFDDMQRQLDKAIGATNGVDDARELRRQSSALAAGKHPPKSKVGGLVHVFLENGKALKITQTEQDLYISFDRVAVEEYHFGEGKMINIGQASAQRVSGWEGKQFVVETLGKEGMKMTERYHLIEEGTQLRRQILLRAKNGDEVTVFQTFSRVGN